MFKLPEDLESKYEFVILASKRAEQLQTGALPRVEGATTKPTVVAQQEVASGLVRVIDPDAEVPEEEAEEE
jgi:DNA-directed RNA polymerase omega subunit